jgi:hypothetical protein
VTGFQMPLVCQEGDGLCMKNGAKAASAKSAMA